MVVETIEFSRGNPIPYKVYVTKDKDFMAQYSNEMFQLISASYKTGNVSIQNPNKILKSSIAKLVFNDAGQIIALSLYSDNIGGFKRFCSASRQDDPKYKEAVQEIIKSDIEPYDNWFWVEASGPIEHYFKKHGGNPIPNYLAHKILQKPKKDIVELNADDTHYKRFLRSEDLSPTEKMIFGFKDKATMELVKDSIEDYDRFKIDANATAHELLENEDNVTEDDIAFESAIVFINELSEWNDAGCNEMLKTWRSQLDTAVSTLLKEQNNPDRSQDDLKLVDSNLRLADFLSKHMPTLEFKQFKLK